MFVFRATAFLCAAITLGCGGGKVEPVQRVKVSGSVKLDGKPLSTGKILFDANNGQPSGDMNILDGKYEGLAPVGKCKVTINSVTKMTTKEKTGKDGPGYSDLVEFNQLPARYNSKSEIVREVTEAGPNVFDFNELKSK